MARLEKLSIIYYQGPGWMPKSILGTRIRERRRAMGVTQAEMARRIGISASYLNLIERNKRGIAGPLLRRTATALGLRLDELDDAAERRLLETLNEVAAAPDIAALGSRRRARGIDRALSRLGPRAFGAGAVRAGGDDGVSGAVGPDGA